MYFATNGMSTEECIVCFGNDVVPPRTQRDKIGCVECLGVGAVAYLGSWRYADKQAIKATHKVLCQLIT